MTYIAKVLNNYGVTKTSLGMLPSEFVRFAARKYLRKGKYRPWHPSQKVQSYSCCALSLMHEEIKGSIKGYLSQKEGIRGAYAEIMQVPYTPEFKGNQVQVQQQRLTAMLMFATILEDAGY